MTYCRSKNRRKSLFSGRKERISGPYRPFVISRREQNRARHGRSAKRTKSRDRPRRSVLSPGRVGESARLPDSSGTAISSRDGPTKSILFFFPSFPSRGHTPQINGVRFGSGPHTGEMRAIFVRARTLRKARLARVRAYVCTIRYENEMRKHPGGGTFPVVYDDRFATTPVAEHSLGGRILRSSTRLRPNETVRAADSPRIRSPTVSSRGAGVARCSRRRMGL